MSIGAEDLSFWPATGAPSQAALAIKARSALPRVLISVSDRGGHPHFAKRPAIHPVRVFDMKRYSRSLLGSRKLRFERHSICRTYVGHRDAPQTSSVIIVQACHQLSRKKHAESPGQFDFAISRVPSLQAAQDHSSLRGRLK